MKTIDLVYINAGGGHRSAATALEKAIREQGKGWQVRLVNLFEVLDPQDMFRRTTGVKPEHYYNVRLARGWTLGLAQELRILQALIRLSHKSLIGQLRRHWQLTSRIWWSRWCRISTAPCIKPWAWRGRMPRT